MSLPRVLEPEVMDSMEEAIAYDKMDHSAVNSVFVEDLLAAGLPDLANLEVLDLGTGTGWIPIELSGRHPSLKILAVDLSPAMLDLARNHVEVRGLSDRIQFDLVDAKGLSYSSGRFTVVMSNSIVHHIAAPESIFSEATRLLMSGGLVFFRDLLRPSTTSELDQLVTQYAGDESEHARQLFRDSLHAALTVEEVQEIVMALGYAADSVQATSDRHWTWSARKH